MRGNDLVARLNEIADRCDQESLDLARKAAAKGPAEHVERAASVVRARDRDFLQGFADHLDNIPLQRDEVAAPVRG